jgi:putative transcriptional regulator
MTEAVIMTASNAGSIREERAAVVAFAGQGAEERLHAVRIPEAIDVRAIRGRLDLTQQEFAISFGFSVNTVRHWEQGRRAPEGPARAYLLVIDREPEAVRKALRII